MKAKRYLHESAGSIRSQEIGRLRAMAAEAAKRGERLEAFKLDRLADDHAQDSILVPKVKKASKQLKLFGD